MVDKYKMKEGINYEVHAGKVNDDHETVRVPGVWGKVLEPDRDQTLSTSMSGLLGQIRGQVRSRIGQA